jgi:hypothetical protein
VAALREHVARLGDMFVQTFQGVVTTEAQADELLAALMDRVVGKSAPKHGEGTERDAMLVAVVDVLTRHLVAQARDGIVRQLLAAKRN